MTFNNLYGSKSLGTNNVSFSSPFFIGTVIYVDSPWSNPDCLSWLLYVHYLTENVPLLQFDPNIRQGSTATTFSTHNSYSSDINRPNFWTLKAVVVPAHEKNGNTFSIKISHPPCRGRYHHGRRHHHRQSFQQNLSSPSLILELSSSCI